MAGGALHFGANMRSVIESDMGFFGPTRDAFPGNIMAFLMVTAQFHDLRVIAEDFFMTAPTRPDIGDGRPRAASRSDVAFDASQFGDFQMDAVNKSDRLLRFGAVSNEVLCGFQKGLMRRRKNAAFTCAGWTRLRGKISCNEPHHAACGKNCYNRSLPVAQAITSL
jgi:hypothetical protein